MERTNATRQSRWPIFGAAGAFLLTQAQLIWSMFTFGTIGGTLLSLLVSVAAIAVIAPLNFAVGVMALVLIHELGHVVAARRKGLPTKAPVFIPFIGAIVNMRRNPRDAATEAYIALGGPLLGSAGALAAFLLGLIWHSSLFIALAAVGFALNLLNLLPIYPLDGGKIVMAVSRWLWLAGLAAGLALIVYFKWYLLLPVWLWLAWELLKKFWASRGKKKVYAIGASYVVSVESLQRQGFSIPPANYNGDIPFTTYSELNGKQHVVLMIPEIGLRGMVAMPQQGIIRRVRVLRIDRRGKKSPDLQLVVRCSVEYEHFHNDSYYDVPLKSRWLFGIAYGLLSVFLIFMLFLVSDIGSMIGLPTDFPGNRK